MKGIIVIDRQKVISVFLLLWLQMQKHVEINTWPVIKASTYPIAIWFAQMKNDEKLQRKLSRELFRNS